MKDDLLCYNLFIKKEGNKITVQHNDFDNICNYSIQKFDTNPFATYQLVLVNS